MAIVKEITLQEINMQRHIFYSKTGVFPQFLHLNSKNKKVLEKEASCMNLVVGRKITSDVLCFGMKIMWTKNIGVKEILLSYDFTM